MTNPLRPNISLRRILPLCVIILCFGSNSLFNDFSRNIANRIVLGIYRSNTLPSKIAWKFWSDHSISASPKASTLYSLARGYQMWGNPNLAVRYLNDGLELSPDDQVFWVILGKLYLQLDQYDKAIGAFSRADASEYFLNLAERSYSPVDSQDAQYWLTIAADAYPENSPVLHALGEIYRRDRNYEKAIEVYKRYKSIFPADCIGLYALGELYYDLQQYDIARTFFHSCIDVLDADPKLVADSYHKLAQIAWYFHNDKENAEEYIQQALQVYPQHIESMIRLGELAFAKGNYSRALEIFSDDVLWFNPYTAAMAGVIWCYLGNQCLNVADTVLKDAILLNRGELNPNHAAITFRNASYLCEQNEYFARAWAFVHIWTGNIQAEIDTLNELKKFDAANRWEWLDMRIKEIH